MSNYTQTQSTLTEIGIPFELIPVSFHKLEWNGETYLLGDAERELLLEEIEQVQAEISEEENDLPEDECATPDGIKEMCLERIADWLCENCGWSSAFSG